MWNVGATVRDIHVLSVTLKSAHLKFNDIQHARTKLENTNDCVDDLHPSVSRHPTILTPGIYLVAHVPPKRRLLAWLFFPSYLKKADFFLLTGNTLILIWPIRTVVGNLLNALVTRARSRTLQKVIVLLTFWTF